MNQCMKRGREYFVGESKMDMYNAAASNLNMHVNKTKRREIGYKFTNHTHALDKIFK